MEIFIAKNSCKFLEFKIFSENLKIIHPDMLKITNKRPAVSEQLQKFPLDVVAALQAIHGECQIQLARVEVMFNRTVHRVVRCSENAAVTGSVNGLLDQDVVVRVQIVHGEGVPAARDAGTQISQNTLNKGQKPFNRSPPVSPMIEPSSGGDAYLMKVVTIV